MLFPDPQQLRPKKTAKIGLAYGYSTIYILAALHENGFGSHIAIDPYQSYFHDIGIHQPEKVGMTGAFRWICERSVPVTISSLLREVIGLTMPWLTSRYLQRCAQGVYALSEIARRRFRDFPDLVADDTYVRVQFKREKRETLSSVKSIVFVPHTVSDLVAIEARADFGTFQLGRLYPELWTNKGESNHKTLVNLFKRPPLWPQLFIYWYVRFKVRRKARVHLRTNTFVWERDETSRGARTAIGEL